MNEIRNKFEKILRESGSIIFLNENGKINSSGEEFIQELIETVCDMRECNGAFYFFGPCIYCERETYYGRAKIKGINK